MTEAPVIKDDDEGLRRACFMIGTCCPWRRGPHAQEHRGRGHQQGTAWHCSQCFRAWWASGPATIVWGKAVLSPFCRGGN